MGELPQMKECVLCLLPRQGASRACGVCGYEGAALETAAGWDGDYALELIGRGDLGAAYDWLEGEVREGRESAEYCRRLAWLGLAIGDIRAVEIWSHESLRLAEDWAEPHVLLGYALLREGRSGEALEELEAALRRAMPLARAGLVSGLRDEARRGVPEWG